MARRKKRKSIFGTIPGYTPDYPSLIENDPTYHQFVVGQQGQSTIGRNARNTGIFQKLLAYGAVPAGADLGDFNLTPEQMAAIQANATAGISGQLGKQHNVEVQNLQDVLASRGMLRSGGLGVGLTQEQAADSQRRSQALSNESGSGLLDILQGLQTAFADAEQDRYDKRYGPGGAAETTQSRLMASGLYEPRAARKVKAFKVGPNLYRDANGNYYDRHGKPIVSGAKPVHGRPGSGHGHGGYGSGGGGYTGGGGRYEG